MRFNDFCKEKGIKLLPWQEKVSKAAFSAMNENYECRAISTGKTRLFILMLEFIEEYGHEIDV